MGKPQQEEEEQDTRLSAQWQPGGLLTKMRTKPGSCHHCVNITVGAACSPGVTQHLVNEYLTAPKWLLHNSCRLSISVYRYAAQQGSIQATKGEGAVWESAQKPGILCLQFQRPKNQFPKKPWIRDE